MIVYDGRNRPMIFIKFEDGGLGMAFDWEVIQEAMAVNNQTTYQYCYCTLPGAEYDFPYKLKSAKVVNDEKAL